MLMAKILIVEDDPLMSRMYQKIFKFEGYEVEMAGNGEEGLKIALKEKPDIILLDIVMPKMDGMEMLQKLKADAETRDIPVVILTNLSDYEKISEALSLGAMDYLVKANYKLEDLLEKVRTVLARR